MDAIEQGDILKVRGISHPVVVVSNSFFNQNGKVIVCPIVVGTEKGPLHIEIKDKAVKDYVLCEQVKYLDLNVRPFSKLAEAHYFEIMDLSDAIMGMFDYQQL